MHSKAVDLDQATVLVAYDKQKSPLNISITPLGSNTPAFGAMVYAIHTGTTTPVTVLRDSEGYNETVTQLAKAVSQKFNRPVFVNSSVIGGMRLVREVVAIVTDLLATSEKETSCAKVYGQESI